MVKLTSENFIEKAKRVHGDKYDYSKVIYKCSHSKVCIICSKHGEFWQISNNHLNGKGCPICGKEKRSQKQRDNRQDFVLKAKKVHGNKYDYLKSEYVDSRTKVCIICPIHGEFFMRPNSHINGQGCQKCGRNETVKSRILTTTVFIERARKIHGDKYDYSKSVYKNSHDKVCIFCHKRDKHGIEHGEFWQEPCNHLNGQKCPKCYGKLRKTTEQFIGEANETHGSKYDYSKVEYKDEHTKVCIICPDHGEFWQTPNKHLIGCGCPKCKQSHLERDVMNILNEMSIEIEYQKRYSWLGRQSLDFYLPDYNIAIECQGEQHFRPVNFGGVCENELITSFKNIKENDRKKEKLCIENGINLKYINYNDNIMEKIKEILNCNNNYE